MPKLQSQPLLTKVCARSFLSFSICHFSISLLYSTQWFRYYRRRRYLAVEHPQVTCASVGIIATRGKESIASLLMSSSLAYPETFIKMSNSASRPFMTCFTPVRPAIDRPQTHSRPRKTNFAPIANALKMSAALRTPESKVTLSVVSGNQRKLSDDENLL
jgi:hypothetical protein